MAEDELYDTTPAADGVPLLPQNAPGEADTIARVAERLAAAMTAALAARGGGAGNVTVNIAAPDSDSFRRSEAYVAGQIARAVARGQRTL